MHSDSSGPVSHQDLILVQESWQSSLPQPSLTQTTPGWVIHAETTHGGPTQLKMIQTWSQLRNMYNSRGEDRKTTRWLQHPMFFLVWKSAQVNQRKSRPPKCGLLLSQDKRVSQETFKDTGLKPVHSINMIQSFTGSPAWLEPSCRFTNIQEPHLRDEYIWTSPQEQRLHYNSNLQHSQELIQSLDLPNTFYICSLTETCGCALFLWMNASKQ